MLFLTVVNTFSTLISEKIFFHVCNSTLPPRHYYHFDNQRFMRGGIMGGIRVELHVIPPIIPPRITYWLSNLYASEVEGWNFF